jgi:hypothetical protein
MRTDAQAGWAGAPRWRWRWPRVGVPRVGLARVGLARVGLPRRGLPWLGLRRLGLARPGGIRNGGLLLVLVTLAAVMALVDRPPEPGTGRSLPGVFQHLPPPAGITALPPAVEQPPAPAGSGGAVAPAGSGERPMSLDRAHPNRQHLRPDRSGSARDRSGGTAGQPPVGGGDGGQGGDGTPPPPVTAPPAAPAVRVQVPSVDVRVQPPALLGRDLPEVRAGTPAVTVATPAAEVPQLRLG